MKLFKKVLVLVAVLSLVGIPVSASAATDVVDFEDGTYAGFSMKADEDGCDASIMSVVDFNGSKALLVDVQDATMIPKLLISVSDLFDASALNTISTIEFDLTIVNQDGIAPGWNGGAIGSSGKDAANADAPLWSQSDWTLEEYTNTSTATTKMTRTFLMDTQKFVNDTTASYLFMKWAGTTSDMYIDNVRFLDAAGVAVALKAAPAEVVEEVATDDAVATTDALPQTGSTSYALYFLVGAAAMFAGAVVLKKRNVVQK